MTFITANDADATLASGISAAATSLTVTTGQGARFPVVAAPDKIACLLVDAGGQHEYVDVTGHTFQADTFTIVRAVDAYQSDATPAALAFAIGATLRAVVTKRVIEAAEPIWLPAQSNPLAKASGIQLYGRSIAGRVMPKWMPPSGVDQVAQPELWGNNVMLWKPSNGANAGGSGFGATTSDYVAFGTASHPALATTAPAILNAARRTRFTSATTAAAGAGLYHTQSGTQQYLVWMGNGVGLGGFFFHARFAHVSAVVTAGARMFVGLSATSASAVAADPSTLANTIGFGFDAGDAATNYFIVARGASTLTKVGLSTVTARATNLVFDVFIYSAPNSQTVTVRVDLINTNGSFTTVHEQTFGTTAVPASTVFLKPHVEMNNAALTRAEIIDVMSIYVESDY